MGFERIPKKFIVSSIPSSLRRDRARQSPRRVFIGQLYGSTPDGCFTVLVELREDFCRLRS
jgi:hypothetical protein